jgi:hypothetical protein
MQKISNVIGKYIPISNKSSNATSRVELSVDSDNIDKLQAAEQATAGVELSLDGDKVETLQGQARAAAEAVDTSKKNYKEALSKFKIALNNFSKALNPDNPDNPDIPEQGQLDDNAYHQTLSDIHTQLNSDYEKVKKLSSKVDNNEEKENSGGSRRRSRKRSKRSSKRRSKRRKGRKTRRNR